MSAAKPDVAHLFLEFREVISGECVRRAREKAREQHVFRSELLKNLLHFHRESQAHLNGALIEHGAFLAPS